MAVYRTPGGHPLGQLRHEFDRIFSDLTRYVPASASAAVGRDFPALNVWDSEQELFAEAEVPGLKQEDLEIYVVGNELTLRGNRPASEPAGGTFHRRERGTGKFSRIVRLPVEVDSSRVQANLRNGVLELRLPKAEAAKPRKIEVQIAN